MSKLTKSQAKLHAEALARARKDKLTDDDREFIFAHFHPGANHINGEAGAFFTPLGLANDLMIDARGLRVLDLCAGIGVLSMPHYWSAQWDSASRAALAITCVEINPAYVEIGRKIAPWARWICADAFDVTAKDLGTFDVVVSNPPFGRARRAGAGPRYTGPEFEFHLIDHAAQFASRGAFIVPKMSAPFRSKPYHQPLKEGRGVDFIEKTGILLEAGCGIDCDIYRDEWLDVAPSVEVVCADFETARPIETRKPARQAIETAFLAPSWAGEIATAKTRAEIAARVAAPVRLKHAGAPDPRAAACDLFDETARNQQELF